MLSNIAILKRKQKRRRGSGKRTMQRKEGRESGTKKEDKLTEKEGEKKI